MFQSRVVRSIAVVALAALVGAAPAAAQRRAPGAASAEPSPNGLVTLDFNDAELSAVIETIAKMTGRNFIYDDRVRGRVTIVSPSPMPIEQAYAVFESVLQVKGFTTVTTPGGAIKVVPIREAKESSVETVASSARPPNRDRFVTRLIPLNYIDAESIVNTLKPLVSKDAAMAAYAPTNTVILTESASNIRRLIEILASIDVETYKEELAVIPVEYADAATLAEQVSEIYGADVASTSSPQPTTRRRSRRRSQGTEVTTSGSRAPVRILTDERTNSLLVLAPRSDLEEVRQLVAKLDVPASGGGRIHVYYLKNADAEELAQTLSGLLGGGGGATRTAVPPSTPGQAGSAAAPAIRTAVAGLMGGGVTVTADPATNSLIIQASKEGFDTLADVIERLDVERPQVLVEALIMEVDVSDGRQLGFNALLGIINGDTRYTIANVTDNATSDAAGAGIGADDVATAAAAASGLGPLAPLIGRVFRDTTDGGENSGSIINGIIRASASNGDTNIISAPHILTSDNEQAEIRVGDNIPIVSSRVQSANTGSGLATSVNVERQDIGVTLRVTPQITEGETLRLEIFQEITAVNEALSDLTGSAEEVGVALTNRRVENTVVVGDGETVVIGGLISDDFQESVTKIPWLGDIPVLGWAFKTKTKSLTKKNLLVFLTPSIIRSPLDLESETIRKREEFIRETEQAVSLSDQTRETERERYLTAAEGGELYVPLPEDNPIEERLAGIAARYPVERMREIEETQLEELARLEAERAAALSPPRYYLRAAVFGDPDAGAALLTDLIDSGHDGTMIAEESGDGVLYELRLGPYEDLDEAQIAAKVIRRSHGLAPDVIVVEPEPDVDSPRGAGESRPVPVPDVMEAP